MKSFYNDCLKIDDSKLYLDNRKGDPSIWMLNICKEKLVSFYTGIKYEWNFIMKKSHVFENKLKIAIISILLLVIACSSNAATNNLNDCSLSTVQTAINNASDGDTIVCPAGSWTWTSQLHLTGTNSYHQITLQGAGIDKTIITSGVQNAIFVNRNSNKSFRLTGFTFKQDGNSKWDTVNGMLRAESGTGFRIDHNKFLPRVLSGWCSYSGPGVLIFAYMPVVTGQPYGVIDHNEFRNISTSHGGLSSDAVHAWIYPFGGGSTISPNLAWSWPTRISYGQPNAGDYVLFVEDNIFEEQINCSAEDIGIYPADGMIYVDRYNDYTGVMAAEGHGFGTESGIREMDINHNKVHGSFPSYMSISFRGGSGVLWANDFTDYSGSTDVWMVEYRLYTSGLGSVNWANPRHEGRTINSGTLCTSTASNAEGSSPGGWYPCTHQIGTGMNDSSDPFYIWGNVNMKAPLINSTDQPALQNGRDYFYTSCSGSTPCTNGAKPGYVPYPYPHPLTGGGQQSGSVPNPPLNLQIK
jgi:hypothetical protein